MISDLRAVIVGLLCFGVVTQGNAITVARNEVTSITQSDTVQIARRDNRRFRRGRYDRYERRYRRRDRVGAAVGIGIVGAIIAGGIAESEARDRSGRCAATFRTYNPETGTYIANGGYERRCPYL